MKPVECDIVNIKTMTSGVRIDVRVAGHSTYAVSFRMAAAGPDGATPARILSTSSGRINEDDDGEVVDLPAGTHQILVAPPDDAVGKRTYIGLCARVYNVLDRIVEATDD